MAIFGRRAQMADWPCYYLGLNHVLVLAELALDQHRDVNELLGRHLGELCIVLAQDGDGTLQRTDGLEHVLLLAVELREFLLANGGGLVEGRLVLRDLGPEVLDLRVQPRRNRGVPSARDSIPIPSNHAGHVIFWLMVHIMFTECSVRKSDSCIGRTA